MLRRSTKAGLGWAGLHLDRNGIPVEWLEKEKENAWLHHTRLVGILISLAHRHNRGTFAVELSIRPSVLCHEP